MGAFDPEYLKKAFDRFGRTVVDKARNNLTNQGKSVSGKLSKSLDYSMKESASGDSFSFSFLMEEYGEFQDKGVSGIKKKYNTPYSYKSKMPPRGVLDRWAVRKGLQGIRDDKGRFISRKSLVYLIQRSIYYKGIKPSYFFSKAFKLEFKRLPQDIREAFQLDLDEFMKFTLQNIFK